MGEIAEMMLEGILCQICGVYLDEDESGEGYPMTCESCQRQEDKPKKKNKKH